MASYLLVAAAAFADPVRVAAWHGDFSRKGPGLLLKELVAETPVAGLDGIVDANPDILLLTNFDYDAGLVALTAFQDRLSQRGVRFYHVFSQRPNTGMTTGVDVDGDGRKGGPRDAQGFGYFSGQGGQAILSRYPLQLVHDKTALLWGDAPANLMAENDPVGDDQRLSSSAHWAVQVSIGDRQLILLTLAATPPVFDGPEDRNGRRNRDEVLLWPNALSAKADYLADTPTVLLGNFNLDPDRGDGIREAAAQVLDHPRLQDPLPKQTTVTWDRVGAMRVTYVLPDASLTVSNAKIMPPVPDAGPHQLVWVDLAFP